MEKGETTPRGLDPWKLLSCVATGLGGFSLFWVFNANATLATMQTTLNLKFKEIEASVEALADDSGDIERIDGQLTKHWKIHSWTRDQITRLRHKHELPVEGWPDLGGPQ